MALFDELAQMNKNKGVLSPFENQRKAQRDQTFSRLKRPYDDQGLVPNAFPSMIKSLKEKVSANEQQDFQNKFDYMKSMQGGDAILNQMEQNKADDMRYRLFANEAAKNKERMDQDRAQKKKQQDFMDSRPDLRNQSMLPDSAVRNSSSRLGAEGKLGQTRTLYSPNRGKRLAIRARKAGFGNAAERLYYDWASGADGNAPTISNRAMRDQLASSKSQAMEMQQMNEAIIRDRMKRKYNLIEDVKITPEPKRV